MRTSSVPLLLLRLLNSALTPILILTLSRAGSLLWRNQSIRLLRNQCSSQPPIIKCLAIVRQSKAQRKSAANENPQKNFPKWLSWVWLDSFSPLVMRRRRHRFFPCQTSNWQQVFQRFRFRALRLSNWSRTEVFGWAFKRGWFDFSDTTLAATMDAKLVLPTRDSNCDGDCDSLS